MGVKLGLSHTLRVLENFGPKRDDVYQGSGEDYITRSIICNPRQIFFEWSNQEE